MPPETSATDRYLAEIDRLLGLRGWLRRRVCADVRRRIAAAAAEEREHGLSEADAETRTIEQLGPPEKLAENYQERVLAARVTAAAQAVLVGCAVSAVGLALIGWRVIKVREFRMNGSAVIPIKDQNFTEIYTWDGFFHHVAALDFWLPPAFLSLKLLVAALCALAAFFLAEVGIGLARRRSGSAVKLAALGAGFLVAGVVAQLAFGIQWRRFGQGHNALLLATLAVEAAAALCVAPFFVRPLRSVLRPKPLPLASVWFVVLIAAAPLAAVGAEVGLGTTNVCPDPSGCSSPPMYEDHVVVRLPSGPAGARSAIALQGRKLAVALTTTERQPPENVMAPPTGPLSVSVWEMSWPAALQGPCGLPSGSPNSGSIAADPLAPHRASGCGFETRKQRQHPYWRLVNRIALKRPEPVGLTYLGDGRLALAYSGAGAVWAAVAPGWKPRRVLAGHAEAVKVVAVDGSELVVAAVLHAGGSHVLELARSEGAGWKRVVVAKVANPAIALVQSGAQIGLLFRSAPARRVFELRGPGLALLEKRDLGTRVQGVIGALPGGRIGIAALRRLERKVQQLTIYVARRGRLATLARERMGFRQGLCSYPAGVVQTGLIVRLLGQCYYSAFEPPYHVLNDDSSGATLASGWPRFAVLNGWPQVDRVWTRGKVLARWTAFDLYLWQPPERQLADENRSD